MNTRDDGGLSYSDLARQGARVEQKIRIEVLERLAELVDGAAEVEVELDFRLDGEGEVWVAGRIRADLDLQCQRCAQGLTHTLDTGFEVCVVASEQRASELNDGRDLLVASSTQLSVAEIVAEIIEDELILSLPQALCTQDPCERVPALYYGGPGHTPDLAEGVSGKAAESTRPFEGLDELIAAAERTPGKEQ
jgi:uncharacterized protein